MRRRCRRMCPRCGINREHRRTQSHIVCRACGLKRPAAAGSEWSDHEDRLVEEAARANLSLGLRTPEGRTHGRGTCTAASFERRMAKVAEIIGRTPNAVRLRAIRLEARSRHRNIGTSPVGLPGRVRSCGYSNGGRVPDGTAH